MKDAEDGGNNSDDGDGSSSAPAPDMNADATTKVKKIQDNEVNAHLRGPSCLEQASGQRTAISFTGGKDCHLALHKARQANLQVVCLAVFHPPGPPSFRAHRIQLQQAQANAMNLPLVLCPLSELNNQPDDAKDYKAAYAAAIRQLYNDYEIQWIVTGDIDYVGSSTTNFMQEVCQQHNCHGVEVLLPLWKRPRRLLLQEMMNPTVHNLPLFDIRFSCVKSPHFDETWLGRRLDENAVHEMLEKDGLDLTGENGEYHTMVIDGPMYQRSLRLVDMTVEELLDQRGQKAGERWWVWTESTKLEAVSK